MRARFGGAASVLVAAIGVTALSLASCAPLSFQPPVGGGLQTARAMCNEAYPPSLGNYLPHARCVNDAVERYAVPTARHPDLIRLQEEIRAKLSEQVDRRRITVRAGQRRMAEADRLVARAERERDAGNASAAARHLASLEAMLR
jgi:hypothetical protein